MFVQVIQGKVSDASRVRAQLDRWVSELAPGATGWLGSTGGVTDDGTLVLLARFESEEAAQRNSDRPSRAPGGEGRPHKAVPSPRSRCSATARPSTSTRLGTPARPPSCRSCRAGPATPDRVRELMASDPTDWASFRPDILGSVSVGHDGGEWTMALYFTSEEEARVGEQKEPPPEMQQLMEEMDALSVGEPAYYDIRDPWLHAPG